MDEFLNRETDTGGGLLARSTGSISKSPTPLLRVTPKAPGARVEGGWQNLLSCQQAIKLWNHVS